MERLGITVRSDAEYTIVQVAGELDINTAPELDEAVRQARAPGVPLVLDLAHVGFLDTCGLRSLLLANADAAPWGSPLRIVASPAVEQTIRLAGADRVLSVYSDEEHALVGPDVPPVPRMPDSPRQTT